MSYRFLKCVIEKFQSKPSRGHTLLIWIQTILVCHAPYLMTLPDLMKVLSSLYLTADSRVTVFKKLLKLSGRLDLLVSQISANETSITSKNVTTYEEASSDEENNDGFDELDTEEKENTKNGDNEDSNEEDSEVDEDPMDFEDDE